MDILKVMAPLGKTCAMEGSLQNVNDTVPQNVTNTSYYRRRIAEGSLLLVSDADVNKKTKKEGK